MKTPPNWAERAARAGATACLPTPLVDTPPLVRLGDLADARSIRVGAHASPLGTGVSRVGSGTGASLAPGVLGLPGRVQPGHRADHVSRRSDVQVPRQLPPGLCHV